MQMLPCQVTFIIFQGLRGLEDSCKLTELAAQEAESEGFRRVEAPVRMPAAH